MKFPFIEKEKNGLIERTFLPSVSSDELIWHTDLEDRFVKIKQAGGWSLQIDNELPKKLRDEEEIFIPKQTWHRVIKGSTPLIVQIVKLSNIK
jgi:hypothetical protein